MKEGSKSICVAKAAGSAGTPKKKTTSTKQKNNNPPELSDLEETTFNQCKGPPEDIMSLAPHTRRNAVRLTRNALPQPPAHVYILPIDSNGPLESAIEADVYPPPFGKDCDPLDHNSPHNHPSSSYVEAAAHASSPVDALEDYNEEEGINLEEMFNDMVGEETSGLNDLSYSSAKDNEDYDYDNNMEEAACQIEYSDSNNVPHGRQQTNFIPGGPESPSYNGMNEVEKVLAKKKYTKERKKYTDGLQMKRLKDQNEEYESESFTGCLTLVLRPMSDIHKCRLDVNHTFSNKEILAIRVVKEANLRGINLVCTRSDLCDFRCMGPRFAVFARHTDRLRWHVSFANVCECDEFGASVVDVDAEPEKLTSPFRTKWIVPLILPIIVDTLPSRIRTSDRHCRHMARSIC